jgi:nitroimidazol reductase NimA-like FMN-containing flavoprotein (pyridoxamine 5'-phosphate oxidase superfamily)
MADIAAPRFREMDRAECETVLARNSVGRLAYSFHDRVDIEPISYVFADGYIYGRTGPGTKLRTLAHHPWVAFEVDELQERSSWRSVVVHGTVYRLEPDQGQRPDESYARAVEVLRRLMPTAFTPSDPWPERTVVFRIFADEMTGRVVGAP